MHWELLARARAVDNQVYVAVVSPARNPDSDYQAWGHSMVVNPLGQVICSTQELEDVLVIEVDPSMCMEVRRNIPVWQQRRHDLYQVEEKNGAVL